jgi:uncharacterized protein YndB with AHSA1/START domain
MMRNLLAAVMAAMAFTAAAGSASAEVKSAAEGRLVLENTVVIDAPVDKVYAALGKIGAWWDDAHTYSGKASNMSVELKAGSCFCETIPGGGSIKHGEVVLAWPGKFLRLEAPLGPLQDLGVATALTYTLEPAGEGRTKVVQSYKVGGLDAATLKAGPLFDKVIGGSLTRFKAYVETGKPG